MEARGFGFTVAFAILAAVFAASVLGQRRDAFVASRDHPAINYSKGPTSDRVVDLNAKIRDGKVRLVFDGPTGYLRSTLQALDVPVESQVALFSQNSFQADLINMKNPRTLFFNDTVSVAYIRGGTEIEVATHDPHLGVIFYTIDQKPLDIPQFTRNDNCLACHLSWTTLGVPGLFVFSMLTVPEDQHAYASGFASDHRTNFNDRWGGWYVTGSLGSIRHLGNRPISTASTTDSVKPEARELTSLDTQLDTNGYLSRYSDVVALMVLEHQTNMTNLITRVGWESRVAKHDGQPDDNPRVQEAAKDLVDYMLFVDEAALPDNVHGTSGFSERFAALGPTDRRGRSLRQLDLDRRLMRYPCSYMIYSDAFDALPSPAKTLVYRRLWQLLSGEEKDPRYARLSADDRRAIVEILRDTKNDLPDVFRAKASTEARQ